MKENGSSDENRGFFMRKYVFLTKTLAHVARDDINHTVIATYEKY